MEDFLFNKNVDQCQRFLTRMVDSLENLYVHKIYVEKNQVYFSTRAGVFRYKIKAKKLFTILKREKSTYLKKYKYVTAISKDKQGKLEILVSTGWRSAYQLLKMT